MKKFVKKIFVLIIIPVCFVFVTILAYKCKINSIDIPESVHVLIVGDSHTQTGLNDIKIKNSLNVSQSSEHFLYSYNILRVLLNNKSKIDKIILGVSFHSFSKNYDEYLFDSDKTAHMFPRYLSILNNESINDIDVSQTIPYKSVFFNITEDLLFTSALNKYSFIGSHYSSEKSNLNDSTINAAIKRHYYTASGDVQEYSTSQIKYLKKIIELCDKKNLELILINTPVHHNYYKKIPKKFVSFYYSVVNQLKNEVQYYDFHSISIPNKCFGDGDHLNSIGAEMFSIIISKRISE